MAAEPDALTLPTPILTGALPRPDLITVTGVSGIGRHGVFEREKREGQPFIIDAVLEVDSRAAAAADDLELSTSYADVAEFMRTQIAREPVDLIETVAECVAQGILERFKVSAVQVTVHKPKAPIQVPFADVSVTIYRQRSQYGLAELAEQEPHDD